MSGVAEALGQRTFRIKDNTGKDHDFPTLTFGDGRDLEKLIGRPLSDAGNALASFDGQIKVMWAIVRREGLTRAQIREARASGKWPISEDEVGDLFDLSQAFEVFGVLTSALRQGAWVAKEDPTKAGASSETTPATT